MVRTRTIRAPCSHARRIPRRGRAPRASTHLGARTEHSIPSSPSSSTATWACSRMAASIFFDRQGTRRRVPLPALALGWAMDMVSGQPLVVDHWPRTELHDLEGGTTHTISRRLELTRADTEPSQTGRCWPRREPIRRRQHARGNNRQDQSGRSAPVASRSRILVIPTHISCISTSMYTTHGRTERPPKEENLHPHP